MSLCSLLDIVEGGLVLTGAGVHVSPLAASFGMHGDLGAVLAEGVHCCIEAWSRISGLISVDLGALLRCAHPIACLSLLCIVY